MSPIAVVPKHWATAGGHRAAEPPELWKGTPPPRVPMFPPPAVHRLSLRGAPSRYHFHDREGVGCMRSQVRAWKALPRPL